MFEMFENLGARKRISWRNKTVYRFISQREKTAIEENDISRIGSTWEKNRDRSSHRYKKGVRYVHFLDSENDAKDVYNELKKTKKYLCAYSIPANVLRRYAGWGYYAPHGYDVTRTEIKEYAIPVGLYNPDWLVSVVSAEEYFSRNEESMTC